MEPRGQAAGTVVSIWRYPVKSMQGEELEGAAISERGVLGDRAYALLDRATGHIASAKHPGKWSALLACRAELVEPALPDTPLPPVRITLPDGSVISSAQPDADRALSSALGREVTLLACAPEGATREADRSPIDAPARERTITREAMALAAPPGTFFDVAPLHVLTTATLGRLRELYPAGSLDVRRFRPNLIVAPAGGELGFLEDGWLGRELAIGGGVALKAIDPCPRCVVPTLAQADLPRDPGVLRVIAQHNAAASVTVAPGVVFPAVAGIYASVLRGGAVSRGASVWLGAPPGAGP